MIQEKETEPEHDDLFGNWEDLDGDSSDEHFYQKNLLTEVKN